MTIASKAQAAVTLVKRGGVSALLGELAVRAAPMSLTRKLKWTTSIGSETTYWDDLIAQGGGLEGPMREHFRERLDPDLPIQARVAELLPTDSTVFVLDVGAGPLTYLGKKLPGKEVIITAIDPLADRYNAILHKHDITPLVETAKLEAEQIMRGFGSDQFDLCFARNCLDHAYDPEDAILQMIAVTKPDCYVLLEHFRNEAEENGYEGLHQWNFDTSPQGHFLIRSRSKIIDMTERHKDLCDVSCEVTKAGDRDWLVVRIRKRG